MASGPITSWEIDGETVSDFIFGRLQKIKSDTVSIVSPSTYHEVMGPDAVICFLNIVLSQLFTLLFHFHQEAL